MFENEILDEEIAQSLKRIEFVETEPFEKGFAEYFDREIKPVLLGIEEDRLNKLATVKHRRLIFWPVVIIFAAFDVALMAMSGYGIITWDIQGLFYSCIFACLLCYLWYQLPVMRYMSKTREILVPLVIGFFGASYKFQPETDCDMQAVQDSLILPHASRNFAQDRITGNYKGIDLDLCHLKISTGGKNSTTLFAGLFAVLEVHKRFSGTTLITYDHTGIFGDSPASLEGLAHAQLESNDFEKEFDVFTSDQVEARYLLTPDIMESFVELSRENNATVRACFTGQRLYLCMPRPYMLFSGNWIDKTALDTADVHKFLHQMDAILNIIDLLKLDHAIEPTSAGPLSA